ncbi:hypothetical protein Dimus_037616, partial [Dionaea muscipula]
MMELTVHKHDACWAKALLMAARMICKMSHCPYKLQITTARMLPITTARMMMHGAAALVAAWALTPSRMH